LSWLVASFKPDKADAHAMALVNQKMTSTIVKTKSFTLRGRERKIS